MIGGFSLGEVVRHLGAQLQGDGSLVPSALSLDTRTIQPGECFVGAGLWHPEPDTQRKIRQFIFDNPGNWKAAVRTPALVPSVTKRSNDDIASSNIARSPRATASAHDRA